jgi:hypothetical protein
MADTTVLLQTERGGVPTLDPPLNVVQAALPAALVMTPSAPSGQTLPDFVQAVRSTAAPYQVQPNKTIQGPDGKRFIVRGVTAFDGLFVSHESRSDYRYRVVQNQSATSGGSTQTGYEPTVWVDLPTVKLRMALMAASGVNLLRVAVEPAVVYTAAANGYPSHLDMMDAIVDAANTFGMAVQFQNGNDAVPTALNVTFMGQLRDRYWNRKNVWINPANEMNCAPLDDGVDANGKPKTKANPDCTNATAWAAEMRQYVQALRADVTGQPAGTKFIGPIVINATSYGDNVAAVAGSLTGDTAFSADPNLVIGVHIYQASEATFAARIPTLQAVWGLYIGTFPIIIDEAGNSYDATVRDPSLDPGKGTPSDQATLTSHYNWMTDFLAWSRKMANETAFSGITFFTWSWYVPGLGLHDVNSLTRLDGTYAPLGLIVRDGWLAAKPDLSSFAGRGLTNLAYNGDMRLNSRGFAGGALANGVFGYDGWQSVDPSTVLSVGADGTISLTGFIRQTIRGRNLSGQPITVSIGELAGANLNVYAGPPGNPGVQVAAIATSRGRKGATIVLPTTLTGDVAITFQSSGGTATCKDIQIERGYNPTQFDRRPPAVERTIAGAALQRIGNPDGTRMLLGNMVAIDPNTISFSISYPSGAMPSVPTPSLIGTANTDYGVWSNGTDQTGFSFSFAPGSTGASSLIVVATKTGHGLTAATIPGFWLKNGAILLSAE